MDRPDGSPTATDVVLRSEWGAIEGNFRHVTAASADVAPGAQIAALFSPLVGQVYYGYQVSGGIWAHNLIDADKPQHFYLSVYCPDVVSLHLAVGGSGGITVRLDPPTRTIGPLEGIFAFLVNFSGHNVDMIISIRGILLTP